ncbi:MAG TPA: FkbM family methyltransferase [Polyangiaceae bacterium]|jgi:FkbM family methyltransferase
MFGQAFYALTLRCLQSESRASRALGRGIGLLSPRLKRAVSIFSDPPVTVPLGKQRLRMPFSHNLPLYRGMYPSYDTALPRLGAFLGQAARLKTIDVGANIGDSIALLNDEVPADFLAIEADERFLPFLRENAVTITRDGGSTIVWEKCLLSDTGDGTPAPVELRPNAGNSGTSFIAEGGSESDRVPVWTLDALVAAKHPAFKDVGLLKCDTDGYDFKVLRGASNLLANARPALFFEFSPRHLRAVGEDPASIFPFLARLGYLDSLIYSSLGDEVAALRTDDVRRIDELVAFALERRRYFDLLLFHDSERERFALFREREFEQRPARARSSFPAGWSRPR